MAPVVFAAPAPGGPAAVVALAVVDVPAPAASAATALSVLLPSAVPAAYALVPVAFAAVVALVVLAPTLVFLVSGGRGLAPALAIPVCPLFPCSALREKAGAAVAERKTFRHSSVSRINSYRRGFLV